MKIWCIALVLFCSIWLTRCDGMDTGSIHRAFQSDCQALKNEFSGSGAFLDKRITVSYYGMTMGDIVRNLQRVHDLPLSYIETDSAELEDIRLSNGSVRSLLKNIVDARPGYVCKVVEGHVVIYPDISDFRENIAGVHIVDKYRAVAAGEYIDLIKRRVSFFEKVGLLIGGNLEFPIFSERVTLIPEAPVIVHLGELLGTNEQAFFVIQKVPSGYLSMAFGSVRDSERGRGPAPRGSTRSSRTGDQGQ